MTWFSRVGFYGVSVQFSITAIFGRCRQVDSEFTINVFAPSEQVFHASLHVLKYMPTHPS